MKHAKNLFFVILTCISAPLLGAEAPPKPMPGNAQPSLLQLLPMDLQRHLISILANSQSLDEAAKAIRALSQTNRHFRMIINNSQITNSLLAILADHWASGNRIQAAWALRTRGAQEWFDTQEAKKWFREYYPSHAEAINNDFLYVLYGNRYGGLNPWTLSRKNHINSLLKLGLNLNNDLGMNALSAALYKNDLELLKKFLDAGANPNSIRDGEPILAFAAWTNKPEAIKILLDAGADPNPIYADTPLTDVLKRHVRFFPKKAILFEHIIKMLESKKREREEEVFEESKKRKTE